MTIKSQRVCRDLAREREFLQRSSTMSRDSAAFVEHGQHRLAEGESKFADRWAAMSLLEFARELSEEGADLGAWAALADQAADGQIPPSHTAAVRMLLVRIARAGAAAHEGTRKLQDLLEKIAENPEQPRAVEIT